MPQPNEIEQLNKTVKMIADILRAGMTPADQKAKANAEKTAAERMGDMFVGFTKQQEEQRKHQEAQAKEERKTATTWSQTIGLFKGLGKDLNTFADQSNKNLVTWGNLGKVIKESVKNWFTNVMETNTLLGRTFRLGASLWTNVFKKIGSNFKKLTDQITSQIKDVLGPGLTAVYETAKDTIKGAFKTIKSFASSVLGFAAVKPADRARNKLLRGILKVLRLQRKDDKKREKMGFVKGLASGAGGILKALGQMGLVGLAIVGIIGAVIGIWRAVQSFKDFDSKFISDKLGEAFKTFRETILWLPVKLIEWTLGFIGIESEGFTEKFFEIADSFFDYLWGFTLGPIIDFLQGFFGTDGSLVERVKGGFEMMMGNLAEHILEWGPKMMKLWDDAWEGIFTFMDEMIPGLTEGIENFFYMIQSLWDEFNMFLHQFSWLPGLGGMGIDPKEVLGKNIQGVVADQRIDDAEVERLRSQMGLEEVDKETLRQSLEKLAAAQAAGDAESASQIINALSEMRGAESPTEQSQIWEEVDNLTITRDNVDQDDA